MCRAMIVNVLRRFSDFLQFLMQYNRQNGENIKLAKHYVHLYKTHEPHEIDGYRLRIIVYGDGENIRVDHDEIVVIRDTLVPQKLRGQLCIFNSKRHFFSVFFVFVLFFLFPAVIAQSSDKQFHKIAIVIYVCRHRSSHFSAFCN